MILSKSQALMAIQAGANAKYGSAAYERAVNGHAFLKGVKLGNGKGGPKGTNLTTYGQTSTKDASKDFDGKGHSDLLMKYTRPDGTLTPEREALHRELVDSFFAGKTPVKGQATFTMMGGGPATGKSFMIKSGAATLPKGAVQVDSDGIKGMLPEYKQMVGAGDKSAAGYAHEESSALTKRVIGLSMQGNYNTVLDGTGDGSVNGLTSKLKQARDAGMRVEGIYATCPTEMALERATARAAKTGREVNPNVITGTHVKVSKILPQCADQFDDVKLLDTSDKPTVIATGGNGKGLTAVKGKEAALKSFLDKANEEWENGKRLK